MIDIEWNVNDERNKRWNGMCTQCVYDWIDIGWLIDCNWSIDWMNEMNRVMKIAKIEIWLLNITKNESNERQYV